MLQVYLSKVHDFTQNLAIIVAKVDLREVTWPSTLLLELELVKIGADILHELKLLEYVESSIKYIINLAQGEYLVAIIELEHRAIKDSF